MSITRRGNVKIARPTNVCEPKQGKGFSGACAETGRNNIMADKGYTLYMKVALALHVGRIVQLYTIHQNLLRFSCWVCSLPIHHTWKLASLRGCAYSSWPKRDTHYTGNLAHFPCWVYRGHGRKGTHYT